MSKAVVSTVAFVLLAGAAAHAQSPDPLADNFRSPPDAAKPRTWWHWTNGNVTLDGIDKDLAWMQRVGIGGFQLADVASGGGQTVEPKINFGTPEWYGAVRHAAEDAKRLNLEMSIFSSPGWSEAGGPWVTPEHSMKKLVWSETEVAGPTHGPITLAQPPSNEGPVRDLFAGARGANAPHFYADSAVIAYRTPADAVSMASLHPRVTTNAGPIDGAAVLDNSLNTSVTLKSAAGGGPAWLQYEFAQPYTARALSLGSRSRIPVGRVLASDDGVHFRTLAYLPGPQGYHGAAVRTFAFAAATARFFRVEFSGAGILPAAVIHGGPVVPAPEYVISEAVFASDARVHRWEDKGAFGSLMDVYDVVPTPEAPMSAEIARGDVVDLTGRMDPDGTLRWTPPAGRWTVLRLGDSLTGAKNRPATPAGSGYEVDKLSAPDVQAYFHGYTDPLQQQLGGLMGSTLHYMTMDSWEAGMQNWTADMVAQFRQLRGYDPTPWLPVLAGHVVGSAEESDRFLWDFRRTLADMFAANFYGTMERELHAKGMQAYSEASGVALEIPEDTLLNKRDIDVPMAEFWVHALHPEAMYYVDVRGAASAAHAYGRPIVATESFTGGGYESPYTLKKVEDFWFAQGVNRLVFHSTAIQPLDTKPGNTMVGTHLNRNITWAELAAPYMTYTARISYMLQQGAPVVDVAYLLPEGAPSTMPFWGAGLQPAPPPGYDYDYLNTDLLLHHTSVTADGRVALESGMQYRLLVLPPTTEMTPEVLAKLHDLVAAGATILGPRPTHSPSLAHFPAPDAEVAAGADELWADTDGVTKNDHAFGKGTVFSGLALADALDRLKVPQDFATSNLPVQMPIAPAPDSAATPGALPAAPVWVHRRSAEADIYYIANQADGPVDLQPRFRVSGRDAQLFHPMSGASEPAAYASSGAFTTVPLHLAARETVFVVFRGTAAAPARSLPVMADTELARVTGPWELRFADKLGAPPSIRLDALAPWTDNADAGVKYFSGTATYSKTVDAPAAWFRGARPGQHLYLDLGDVRDLAEVSVNGKPVGVVWAPPYRVDVGESLKPGANRIEIRVTNEWANRLMGDRLLPPDKQVIATAAAPPPFVQREAKLAPSGLLGPVVILSTGPK